LINLFFTRKLCLLVLREIVSLHECGGRCLYANITKRWSPEAYALICKTVKNLTESLKVILPRIKRLIKNGKIKLSGFEYMKYNSCEIIP